MGRAKKTRKARLKRPFGMSANEWQQWGPDDKRDILCRRKKDFRELALWYKRNGY